MWGKLLVFGVGAAAGVIGKMIYDESQSPSTQAPARPTQDYCSGKGEEHDATVKNSGASPASPETAKPWGQVSTQEILDRICKRDAATAQPGSQSPFRFGWELDALLPKP